VLEARVARGGRERAMESVGGELGSVKLRRGQAPQRFGYPLRRHSGGLEQLATLDEPDDRRARGLGGAAAPGIEAGLRDAATLDAHRDADEVAASSPARGASVARVRQRAAAALLGQVRREL
jgi:hypothetical protein